MNLYKSDLEELTYRRDLLADPLTMSYNKGLNLGISEYDNSTGCIMFPETTWKNWYNYWMNQEPLRYYAYLVIDDFLVSRLASMNLFTSLEFDQVVENDLITFSMTNEKYKGLSRFRI